MPSGSPSGTPLALALAATLVACSSAAPASQDADAMTDARPALSADVASEAAASEASDAPSLDTSDAPDGIDADVDGGEASDAWRTLFDGTSLAAWQRYLGKPSAAEPPLGLENDPKGVFSIVTVDGEPAIRISGEVWGALISKETFCDFHLRAEYEWGSTIGPSLGFRDSGVMYMSTGPLGAVNAGGPALSNPIGSGAYLVSVEYQITPSDVGDLVTLGPIAFTSLGRVAPVERPGWNHLEIIMKNGVATHLHEGVEVARGQGFTITWPGEAPAAIGCGTLQLESEGSEIFFRHLEIQVPP
jgi:Domain of Unknown Function (DUF1080)